MTYLVSGYRPLSTLSDSGSSLEPPTWMSYCSSKNEEFVFCSNAVSYIYHLERSLSMGKEKEYPFSQSF